MNRLKCLIVDDEIAAIKTIISFVKKRADLLYVASTQDAREVVQLVEANHIELVFIDLHMPHIHGLDLIKQLIGRVQLICCSADNMQGEALFDLGVAFYLNKPIKDHMFNKAIDRVWNLKNNSNNDPAGNAIVPLDLDEYVIFNIVDGPLLRMQLIDLECIEAKDDDVLLTHTDGTDLVRISIGKLERILPTEHFMRVHRGFIVALKNVKKVDFVERNIVLGNSTYKEKIPVGKTYFSAVKDLFGEEKVKGK